MDMTVANGHVKSTREQGTAMRIGQHIPPTASHCKKRQKGKSEIIANVRVKHAVSIPLNTNFVYAVAIVY